MKGRSVLLLALVHGIVRVTLAAGGPPAGAKAPKRGGILNSYGRMQEVWLDK